MVVVLSLRVGRYAAVGGTVADGTPRVIAVESAVVAVFVAIAAAGVTLSAWLIVAGYAGHGLKDFIRSAVTTMPIRGGGLRFAQLSTGSSPSSSSSI